MATTRKTVETAADPSTMEELRDELLHSDAGFRELWNASAAKRAIAIALVRLRKQAGRSQAQLAEAAGWDKAFVSRLESADGPVPETTTLMRYAAACNQAVGLVFASIGERSAHMIDAVTLAAPQSAHPFESLRGEDFAVQDAVAGDGVYSTS